jgi:menaquinone-specific isochorismate synthase
MERDNSRREVAVSYPGEARGTNPLAELALGGPGRNGLGKVGVGLGVRARALGNDGQSELEVGVVARAQNGDGGRGELADDESTTGLEHAVHLAEGHAGVVDVSEPKTNGHRIELVVPERKLLGIRFDEFDGGMLAATLGNHSRREIDGDDARTILAQRRGASARARRDIEDALALSRSNRANGRGPPQYVVAPGKHGIGAVVTFRDTIKHAGDVSRLLVQISSSHGFSVGDQLQRILRAEYSEGVILPVLSVRSEAVPDPGALLPFASNSQPLVFLRAGEGIIGIGEAVRLTFSGPTRIADAASAWRSLAASATVVDPVRVPGSGLVAFGSFAFSAHSDSDSVLIVPEVIMGRRNGVAWVTTMGAAQPPASRPLGDPFAVRFVPGLQGPAAYGSSVRAAVAAITRGEAGKVVLARDLVAKLPADADLRRPLAALSGRYSDTFTFAVDGLIGASPETLVRTVGGAVSARVLAGSTARGVDAASDDLAAQSLCRSAKDLDEHEFARASVLRSLAPFADLDAGTPDPFALRLPNLWHLASDITGTLGGHASALDLVGALHPTAAVAGTPTDVATALIAELEPTDRGRYAGPVGWVDASGDGEWAIALRCAQIAADGTVTAYAGAGIVADSDPARELAETTLKFAPITEAFG